MTDFRNALMHGDSEVVPQQEHVAKLLYWLAGLCVSFLLKLMKLLES